VIMTWKSNPVHVLDKLTLRKMTIFRGSFKVYADKFCYHKVEMEFDCSEELLKFLTQSKVFFIEYTYNKARSQNCENRLLPSSCLFVYPFVRIEKLSCHCTDFHVNLCLIIFPKSVDKIQIPLKSGKNNGHFAWRPIYIFDYISIISS
jgi:hypothetical protein